MSEPTDQHPTEPMDDEALSALYARGSQEQTPKELDQAILDKARQASRQQPGKAKDTFHWSQAMSIAAVFVVSVTLVVLIQKEAPEPESISSQPTLTMKDMATPEPAGKSAAQSATPLVSPIIEEHSAASLSASRPAPLAMQDRPLLNRELKKEARQEADLQRQRGEDERMMDKTMARSPVIALKQEALEQKVLEQETTARDGLASKSMDSGFASGSIESSNTVAISCQQLSEQACFSSAACTLTKDNNTKGYQCRPAKDHCELLFRQSDDTRETCEAKDGCEYVPASCYCPPGVICICGGGEPAQCRSRNDKH